MHLLKRYTRAGAKWSTIACASAAAAYGTYVGITWYRYGNVASPAPEEEDPLLDRFLPVYDIVERHHILRAAAGPVRGIQRTWECEDRVDHSRRSDQRD